MTHQHVKAEVGAVKLLKSAVTTFSSGVQNAASSAVRDAAAAQQQAQNQLELRRGKMESYLRGLQAAERALAQCKDNCTGLERAVNTARQDYEAARKGYATARKAVLIIETAQRDLARQASRAANVVQDQGSVASSALGDLDAKLQQLPDLGLGASIRRAAMGAGVLAEIAVATSGLAPLGGNFAQAVGLDNPVADPSLSHLVQHGEEQAKDFVGDKLKDDAERRNNGAGGKGHA